MPRPPPPAKDLTPTNDHTNDCSFFETTVRFANIYNRCIGFDSSYWHCANDFSKNKQPRLTLIIFWYEIVSGQSGIQRKDMEII